MILSTGFKASDIGMGGSGVYFTTLSPGKPIKDMKWPSKEFRENLLQSNYGGDWNTPARQPLADAVIVCFVNRDNHFPVRPLRMRELGLQLFPDVAELAQFLV